MMYIFLILFIVISLASGFNHPLSLINPSPILVSSPMVSSNWMCRVAPRKQHPSSTSLKMGLFDSLFGPKKTASASHILVNKKSDLPLLNKMKSDIISRCRYCR